MATTNNFKDLSLLSTYSSLEVDLVDDVTVPLLQCSIQYDRGVGFFTSGWLKEAAKGLKVFVTNQGKARIITSPKLTAKDWETIKNAKQEKQEQLLIRTSIHQAFDELEKQLEHDTLAVLSWLIRDDILEFRFAVPKQNLSGGIFHSKLSLFTDSEGNGVALHGSQNDSLQASLNEETLSLFCSWNAGNQWYQEHQKRFNRMWENQFPSLKILHVKDAEKEIMLQHTERFSRPFSLVKKKSNIKESPPNHPHIPLSIKLYSYQQTAIDAWFAENRRGIFEMATGTGKTITSISASVQFFVSEGKIALVVLVPYQHLVTQWINELQNFGYSPIACYQSRDSWWKIADKAIRTYNAGVTNHICIVSTHTTASMEPFQKMISRFQEPYLLIGDEIHGLGASKFRRGLYKSATWRLGLSATPDRWYDEEGTQFLRNYFGPTVIKYDLKQAIEGKFLTPYHYHPVLIDLSDEEIENYTKLSKMIAQIASSKKVDNDRLEYLLRERANVIGSASNKLPNLLKIVRQHQKECEAQGTKLQHLLFYCNKGSHREVLAAVANLGIRAHEFVHDVSLDKRQKMLNAFSKGEIDALVAIRCLDEGVDVPATQRAYILASSTNPREFVQRRGRILRKAPGKAHATLYDFLVGPWNTADSFDKDLAKTLLLRELPRFSEFALDSNNYYEARNQIAC